MRHQTAFVLGVVATCLLGIMAGFFFAFAIDVAPAMANLDAQSYITTPQWINRVVRNAVFGATYFVSTLVTIRRSRSSILVRSAQARYRLAAHCSRLLCCRILGHS